MRKTLSIFLLLLLASMLTLSTLPAAKAQHAPITVDGDPTDWTGTPPETDNTWAWSEGEWIWRDMVGDDKGNGTYTYPTATIIDDGVNKSAFTGTDADLTELRIAWNESHVFFLLTFDNITDHVSWGVEGPGWLSDPVQADTTAVAICIDTDLVSGSGMDLVDDGADGIVANLYLPDEALWEYIIEIALADVVLWYYDGAFIAEAVRMFPIAADNVTETIEFAVPISTDPYYGLPDPEGQEWRFFAFFGVQDFEHFREVVAGPPQPWLGGGGADHDFDPRVYDCAFFATKADQEAALNGFTDSEYATMPFGAPLGPSWRAIPEFPLPFGFALIAVVVLAVSFKLRKKLHL